MNHHDRNTTYFELPKRQNFLSRKWDEIKKSDIAIALFIIICGVLGAVLTERYFHDKFISKYEAIFNNITSNIIEIDGLLTKRLNVAANTISRAMSNGLVSSRNDLIALKDELAVDIISIFDENGKFHLTTSEAMNPDYEHHDYYKKLNIFNSERPLGLTPPDAIHEKFVLAKQNAGKFYFSPLMLSMPRNIPNKWGAVWNKEVKQMVDVSMINNSILSIIENNILSHEAVLSIIISDPNGRIIAQSKKAKSIVIKPEVIAEYIPDFMLQKMSKSVLIIKSFGNILKEEIIHSSTNDKAESFLTITAEISKREFEYEIWFIRFIFTILTILTISLSFMIRNKIRTKEETVSTLTTALKNKPKEKENLREPYVN